MYQVVKTYKNSIIQFFFCVFFSSFLHIVYDSAGIPTIQYESIRSKVKRLVRSLKGIIETRKCNREKQIQKELEMFAKLKELFEVSQNEALLSPEQREFLADQRTVRQGLVSSFHIGFNLMYQNSTSTSNQARLQSDPSTSNQIHSQPDSTVNEFADTLDSDNSEFDDSTSTLDDDGSPDFVPSDTRRVKNIKMPLDRSDLKELSKCGGSYRILEKVLSIGIKAAGGDPSQYSISKTTLCGELSDIRSSETSKIMEKASSCNGAYSF